MSGDDDNEEILTQHGFKLSVFTYRLCKKKPSRSPPSLVHHVYNYLGITDDTTESGMPYTFTWTATDVYLTWSRSTLTVMKVQLFGSGIGKARMPPQTTRLLKNALLPSGAAQRKVYFFPEDGERTRSRVVFGESIAKTNAAELITPSTCTFDAEDLGGWASSASFIQSMLVPTESGRRTIQTAFITRFKQEDEEEELMGGYFFD